MKVLVACEFSATVRDAFRARGHDAWSCDLLPTEGNPAFHIQGDVLDVVYGDWDLIIAHPPCTYLANSGVRWLRDAEGNIVEDRHNKMWEAANFFRVFLRLKDCYPQRKVCVENPIPHKYAALPKYTQIVHPWWYGDNESKSICLWLQNLKKLVPRVLEKPKDLVQRVWRMPPGPDRQKERSRFFKGVSDAMAEQWGEEQ